MSPPFADEFVAVCVARDTTMASNLAKQRIRLAPDAKVLAICGNFHAQTSNHSAAEAQLDLAADDSFSKFWPSFAAALENVHPTWRVKSVNVVPHSGGYFASVSSGDGIEGIDRCANGLFDAAFRAGRSPASRRRPLELGAEPAPRDARHVSCPANRLDGVDSRVDSRIELRRPRP